MRDSETQVFVGRYEMEVLKQINDSLQRGEDQKVAELTRQAIDADDYAHVPPAVVGQVRAWLLAPALEPALLRVSSGLF